METHQKDIEEKDPFGQNRRADDEAEDDDEKSFLKALLAERALKNWKNFTGFHLKLLKSWELGLNGISQFRIEVKRESMKC